MTDNAKRLLAEILRLSEGRERFIAAIDGRCASGKSTLAGELGAALSCNVFHMDDFFLRPGQRTPERLSEPGGNADRERFLAEVLLPLKKGEPFSYRPFDCQTMSPAAPIAVTPTVISVIEGAYCCHPELSGHYDLRVFLTTDPAAQMSRIAERNGANAQIFRDKWIPLEERYFAALPIEKSCDIRLET